MNILKHANTNEYYTTSDSYGMWNYIVDEQGVHAVQIANGRVSLNGSTLSLKDLDCAEGDSLQDLVDSFEFGYNQGVSSEDEITLTYETV